MTTRTVAPGGAREAATVAATIAATALAVATLGLAGCATPAQPVAAYEGPPLPRESLAVLAPRVVHLARVLDVRVIGIDGHEVDPVRASEFHLRPGPHEIALRASYEAFNVGGYRTVETVLKVAFEGEAGHTYLPNVATYRDRATGRVDDMGAGYPARCLPANRTLSRGANRETAAEAEACAPRMDAADVGDVPAGPASVAASAPR